MMWMLPSGAACSATSSGCGKYGGWPASGEVDILSAINDMGTVQARGCWAPWGLVGAYLACHAAPTRHWHQPRTGQRRDCSACASLARLGRPRPLLPSPFPLQANQHYGGQFPTDVHVESNVNNPTGVSRRRRAFVRAGRGRARRGRAGQPW